MLSTSVKQPTLILKYFFLLQERNTVFRSFAREYAYAKLKTLIGHVVRPALFGFIIAIPYAVIYAYRYSQVRCPPSMNAYDRSQRLWRAPQISLRVRLYSNLTLRAATHISMCAVRAYL